MNVAWHRKHTLKYYYTIINIFGDSSMEGFITSVLSKLFWLWPSLKNTFKTMIVCIYIYNLKVSRNKILFLYNGLIFFLSFMFYSFSVPFCSSHFFKRTELDPPIGCCCSKRDYITSVPFNKISDMLKVQDPLIGMTKVKWQDNIWLQCTCWFAEVYH